jgi:hypothetical protein
LFAHAFQYISYSDRLLAGLCTFRLYLNEVREREAIRFFKHHAVHNTFEKS